MFTCSPRPTTGRYTNLGLTGAAIAGSVAGSVTGGTGSFMGAIGADMIRLRGRCVGTPAAGLAEWRSHAAPTSWLAPWLGRGWTGRAQKWTFRIGLLSVRKVVLVPAVLEQINVEDRPQPRHWGASRRRFLRHGGGAGRAAAQSSRGRENAPARPANFSSPRDDPPRAWWRKDPNKEPPFPTPMSPHPHVPPRQGRDGFDDKIASARNAALVSCAISGAAFHFGTYPPTFPPPPGSG